MMPHRRTRFYNSAFTSDAGALGVGDRGAYNFLPQHTGNPYSSNDYVYRWRQYTRLYETSWEARKIIRIIPEDALRKPWIAEDIPEEISSKIQNRLKQLQFDSILKRSLMLERLLGGCLTFMGLDSQEDDPSKVFHPKEGAHLRFLNAIPISRIARVDWDHNPLSSTYMRPSKFLVNGNTVDVSRCLVWDGEPLFDPYDFALTQFRSNLAGFGPSKLAPIWDDIVKAVGTRQAAYQLIQTNNAIIAAVSGLQDLQGTTSGRVALQKVKDIAQQLSAYRAALIDDDKVQITQHSASFGSVPELLLMFLQILCGASDIPATRFIGQAPGGLNATGESDLENYYNVIDAYQRQRIEPQIRRVYDIEGYRMWPSQWHKIRENLTFKFPPLWNASELEEAQTATARIDNALKVYEVGGMDEVKLIEELNAQNAFSVELDEIDTNLLGGIGDDVEVPGEGQDEPPSRVSRRTVPSASGTLSPREGGKSAQQEGKYTSKEPDGKGGWIYHYNRTPDFKAELQKIRNMGSAARLIVKAGGEPKDFIIDEFLKGYQVEQEHIDVTKGDPVTTAKIVLDHLREKANYYTKLEKVENTNYPPPTPKSLHGLPFGIENPKGSIRTGKDKDQDWQVRMPADYGHIRLTEGSDGEEVDAYIGPHPESELVFVVDQVDVESGEFDEHKCIFGCLSMIQAKELYVSGFSDGKGPDRIGSIAPVHVEQFKQWLSKGDTKAPYSKG